MTADTSPLLSWRPIESKRRVGDHVETVTLSWDKITVSYSGPPIPHELEAELSAFWAKRLEKLAWEVLIGPAPVEPSPEPARSPVAFVRDPGP